jgi:hypothetical protein
LWQPIENQNSAVEERAWEIALRLRKYLRLFWEDSNDRARDWYIHRAREYHYRLRILPNLLKFDEPMRPIAAEGLLDHPPQRNPVETALYELQKRAMKPSLSPRVCPHDECEYPYFLSTEKGQKFCPDCRQSEARTRARERASKLKWWTENRAAKRRNQ